MNVKSIAAVALLSVAAVSATSELTGMTVTAPASECNGQTTAQVALDATCAAMCKDFVTVAAVDGAENTYTVSLFNNNGNEEKDCVATNYDTNVADGPFQVVCNADGSATTQTVDGEKTTPLVLPTGFEVKCIFEDKSSESSKSSDSKTPDSSSASTVIASVAVIAASIIASLL